MTGFEVVFDIEHEIAWPILIAMYIFFTGMSAGSFVLSTMGNVFGIKKFKPLAKIGLVLATILLILAPLFLIFDLEQPFRALSTLYRTNIESPMSWGVYLLTLYPILCVVYAWFLFRADFIRMIKKYKGNNIMSGLYYILTLGRISLSKESLELDKKMCKALGTIGVPLAIMVHGYTGVILSVQVGRDLYHTSLMPFYLWFQQLHLESHCLLL